MVAAGRETRAERRARSARSAGATTPVPRLVAPFQGLRNSAGTVTQGVALGCRVWAFQARERRPPGLTWTPRGARLWRRGGRSGGRGRRRLRTLPGGFAAEIPRRLVATRGGRPAGG